MKTRIKEKEKKERADKREKHIKRQMYVTKGSSGGESIHGSTRNLIEDETRKMSERVSGYVRVLPGVSPSPLMPRNSHRLERAYNKKFAVSAMLPLPKKTSVPISPLVFKELVSSETSSMKEDITLQEETPTKEDLSEVLSESEFSEKYVSNDLVHMQAPNIDIKVQPK